MAAIVLALEPSLHGRCAAPVVADPSTLTTQYEHVPGQEVRWNRQAGGNDAVSAPRV